MNDRYKLDYEDFYDDSGKPLYIKPLGDPIASLCRMTTKEWISTCTCCYSCDPTELGRFVHWDFTMITSLEPCRTRKIYSLYDARSQAMHDLQITLAFHYHRPSWQIFGPYEIEDNRAMYRAAEYLVKHGMLQLIDVPENHTIKSWIRHIWNQR